jgi:hypothetical protein
LNASILDLRYKMKDVLNALNRRERVRILYHGKLKGEIIPVGLKPVQKSSEHPMFGMLKEEKENPVDVVNKIRKSRYNDI